MSSNPVLVCQWLATGRWFSPGSPVSSTNKTDRHDITEILLKVALNTTTQNLNHWYSESFYLLTLIIQMKMGQQYLESINIHTRRKRGFFIKNSLELRTGKSKKIYYIYNILMCIDIFLFYPIIIFCLFVVTILLKILNLNLLNPKEMFNSWNKIHCY